MDCCSLLKLVANDHSKDIMKKKYKLIVTYFNIILLDVSHPELLQELELAEQFYDQPQQVHLFSMNLSDLRCP